MRTIHKYSPKRVHDGYVTMPAFGEPFDLDMHTDAVVVKVGIQGEATPTLWVEVDDQAPLATYRFMFVGTGQTIPQGYEYRGTAICGVLVYHLYEEIA